MAFEPAVCYRHGDFSPEAYDEAIQALTDAKNQRASMAKGEYQSGCSVCSDTGHTVESCHHDPLQLAREGALSHMQFRCYHCDFVCTTDEEAKEHFGSSEAEIARCLRDRAE